MLETKPRTLRCWPALWSNVMFIRINVLLLWQEMGYDLPEDITGRTVTGLLVFTVWSFINTPVWANAVSITKLWLWRGDFLLYSGSFWTCRLFWSLLLTVIFFKICLFLTTRASCTGWDACYVPLYRFTFMREVGGQVVSITVGLHKTHSASVLQSILANTT